ncbi:retrovirus-related pol polyprotein from transposon TNT 1-94 [Tanacetum coccineum]
MNEDKIKKDLEEIKTINIELDHRVSKLIAENEHLKQTYKQLYNSIKPSRIRSKEQCDGLINQVNLKSVEIFDLNDRLQEKVLVITALKDELRKLKGKTLVDNAITKHTIDPEILKNDVEPITPKLSNNRTAHLAYIKHTQEEAAVLRDLVLHVKANYPLDHPLEYACRMGISHLSMFIRNRDLVTNVFSVGKFCDSNLEVAFRQHTYFIRNLEGVDLLTGSRSKNMYTLSLGDMMVSSPHLCYLDQLPQRLCPGYGTDVHLMFCTCAWAKARRNPTNLKSEDTTKKTLSFAHGSLRSNAMSPSVNGKKAEAVATACYTQNHFIVHLRHDKTPYELLHDKLPDLSFFHVFGALCYPTNDSENLGKLQPKADIGIFIGYEPTKKAFRIYNRLTKTFYRNILTRTKIPHPSTPFVPPSRSDWDLLFQLFDPEPAASTGSPSSTIVDQDAPSPSNSQTTPKTQSPIIRNDVEEDNHDLDVAYMNNDPFFGIPIPENDSKASSSSDVIPTVVQSVAPYSEHVTKWTKDHPLDNIISKLKRPIEAMQEELNEFELLEVWELVPRPDKVMVITLKWIYKTTFLNGILHEEVYVSQPDGFVDQDNLNHVYQLKKAVYGLKQAPRAWYDMLSKFLLSQEFSKGTENPTLFIKRQGKDLLLANPTEKNLHAVKRIFKYLQGTVNRGLWYPKDSSIALTAYVDADHAGFQDTRLSTSRKFDESNANVLERFYTSAGNPVKEILLKLNLPDHSSILTDSKVTPTNNKRMTKPYSSPRFIANGFNARYLKMDMEVPVPADSQIHSHMLIPDRQT